MRTLSYVAFCSTLSLASTAFAQTEAPQGEVAPENVQLEEEAPAAQPATAQPEPPAAEPVPEATPPAPTPAPAPAAQGGGGGGRAGGGANRPGTAGGPEPDDAGDWKFDYHGYFSAPFRVGIGSRNNRYCIPSDNGEAWQTGGPRADPVTGGANADAFSCGSTEATNGQSSTTFHRPLVPDDQYLSWQHSGQQRGDWAEMFFSMGNNVVTGTLAIQGYHFTDGNWPFPEAQFGISQGWVEINHDLGYRNVLFNTRVGSFWAAYGTAGVWDAGSYNTYLFGRTHVMGATTRLEVELDDEYTLKNEIGFGAKRPDPSIYNRARFTMLAHAHSWINWVKDFELGAHIMHSFSATETPIMADDAILDTGSRPNGTDPLYADDNTDDHSPDGSLMTYGLDMRYDMGFPGYLYLGGSQIRAKHAYTVSSAIEVLHSYGGGEFTNGVVDNYLESPYCDPEGNQGGACSNGTGTVSTLLGQYEVSLANFGLFSGGTDLKVTLHGMFNYITADDADEAWNTNLPAKDQRQNGVYKLKYGTDLEYVALPWLSIGTRADRLQPHSKIPEQSFWIISPRLEFRSQMVTREAIQVIYSRYIYNQRECAIGSPADDPFRTLSPPTIYDLRRQEDNVPGRIFCAQPSNSAPDGFGANAANQPTDRRGAPSLRPDINVITVQAKMWW